MRPGRREAWTLLISEAMIALQRDVPRGRMMDATVAALEDACAAIPTGMMREVLARSLGLQDAGGRSVYWDARALLRAFHEICSEREGLHQIRGQKALAENAAGACQRCFGVGREVVKMPDGYTAARPCDHRPNA